MRFRGLIEGFYGTPWSHAERLEMADFLGEHALNTYIYAPKNDPYHRERWRDPYPAGQLAELAELVARCRQHGVQFVFALSPGLSIRYTSDADFRVLTAKFDAFYDTGVRVFDIPLDDMDYDTWHCVADRTEYGTGGGPAGHAHANLLNRVHSEWAVGKGDVEPLHMVPAEYYNVTDSPYKQALREKLDPSVIVHWTGIGVIPQTITREQVASAKGVFGHEILLWDNYPVNDYAFGRLPLAPYEGRDPGISADVTGIVCNQMPQSAVNKVALFSLAEFCRDGASYDATASWHRALSERAAGDPEVVSALRWFADLSWYDGTLHPVRAPRLAAALADFWSGWRSGRRSEVTRGLHHILGELAAIVFSVRQKAGDRTLADQLEAWLEATGHWVAAMQASLDGLAALDTAEPEAAAAATAAVARAEGLVAKAKRVRDSRDPHRGTYPRIADGVADVFIAEAARVISGAEPDHRIAQTSLHSVQENEPALMIDGNPMTFFSSDTQPRSGDFVGVDLGSVRRLSGIEILQAHSGAPDDYLHDGVLEYSIDGVTWRELMRGYAQDVRVTTPRGTQARFVRYRADSDNDDNWLVVREFNVRRAD